MNKPIDLDKERRKRDPQQQYIDLQFDCPEQWLQQIIDDGEVVPGVTGVHFGIDGVPGVIINAEQCRVFADALMKVAKHLDPDGHASWLEERDR